MKKYDIYISCADFDVHWMHPVNRLLKDHGLSTFFSQTVDDLVVIPSAESDARMVLVMLTKSYKFREEITQDLAKAVQYHLPVLVLKKADVALPGDVSDEQANIDIMTVDAEITDSGDELLQHIRTLLYLRDEDFTMWYTSATKGDAEAQYNLGRMYWMGIGVDSNAAEAEKWYAKAAEQGHGEAQMRLGNGYSQGMFAEQDKERAKYWYRLAAEQGVTAACVNISWIYGEAGDVAEAAEWLTRGAELGNDLAQAYLGLLYLNGEGVIKRIRIAHYWLKRSAEQLNPIGQTHLGYMYINGLGVQQDYEKAFQLFSEAVSSDLDEAQFYLGWCYHMGKGVAADYRLAYDWYVKAARQGNENAKNNLAVLCHMEIHPELSGLNPEEDAGVKFSDIRFTQE